MSSAVRDIDIGRLNDIIGQSYRFWSQDRDLARSPRTFHNGMPWHIHGATVLSWITEVNDETAEGEHLERTARAHLIANRATLDLIASAATRPPTRRVEHDDGRVSIQFTRSRPLKLGEM